MRLRKCALGTCIYISVIVVLIFMILFVIVPMAFKYSVGIQQGLIFPTYLINEQDYSDIEQHGINGVRNIYIDVEHGNSTENVTLGVWQILPQEIVSDLLQNEDYNFDGALSNGKYNILLYLHGNGSDRTRAIKLYEILREFFHIFAVDYRGYADSSKAELSEENIVKDLLFVYKWLGSRSKSRIFIWGHSLGTGIGTHLIYELKQDNIVPSGLVLESPFTSVIDVMKAHPIVKFYSFLPWAKSTILDPMVENGMEFNSKRYIETVDCPIMILHAKDDNVIPFEMAIQLFEIARSKRNETIQGNVTLHLYEALGYGHMLIYDVPDLSTQVSNFVRECLEFEEKKQ